VESPRRRISFDQKTEARVDNRNSTVQMNHTTSLKHMSEDDSIEEEISRSVSQEVPPVNFDDFDINWNRTELHEAPSFSFQNSSVFNGRAVKDPISGDI